MNIDEQYRKLMAVLPPPTFETQLLDYNNTVRLSLNWDGELDIDEREWSAHLSEEDGNTKRIESVRQCNSLRRPVQGSSLLQVQYSRDPGLSLHT